MNKEINVIELASELADERLRFERKMNGNTSEIDIEDDGGCIIYTEEAQDEFNELYDMFYNIIMGTMDMKGISNEVQPIPQFINNVDWNILQQQKLTLLNVTHNNRFANNTISEDVNGIIHLIDSIQDYAVEVFGESKVFGDLEKE